MDKRKNLTIMINKLKTANTTKNIYQVATPKNL